MKKSTKSLLSVWCILVLAINLVMPVSVFADDVTSVPDANRIRLLSSLGINISLGETPITRGEFASVICDALKLSDISFGVELPYTDISSADSFYKDVGVLYQTGVLSASDKFNPQSYISAAEVAKIIVSALGYDYVAQAKGGFPGGYIACADGMDIHVGYGASINGNQLADIIFDTLEANPNHLSIGYKVLNYGSVNGFEAFHGVTSVSGILTSDEVTSVYTYVAPTKDGKISIDGKSYKAAIGLTDGERAIGDCVGAYVTAYIKNIGEADEEIIYFDTAESEFVNLKASDIIKNGFEIVCTNGDRDTKYKLSAGFSVILNKKLCADFTDADFQHYDGSVTLADNNGDRCFDVVYIENPEYIVTDKFTSTSSSLSDKNRHLYGTGAVSEIELDNPDAIYEYYMYVDNKRVPCSLEDLESYTTFELVMSRDATYVRLTGFDCSAMGNVTEVSDGIDGLISINNAQYLKTEYLNQHMSYIPFNTYVTAKLTPDGKIITLESDETVMRYGYLMKIATASGFEEAKAAILTDNGQKSTFKFKKSIVLDGNTVPADFSNTTSQVYNKLFDRPQLIRYAVNSEGMISAVDTASVALPEEERYSSSTNQNPNNTLAIHEDITSISKRRASYITCFAPSLVPRTVKIFIAPTILSTANAHNYEFDESDFGIISIDDFPTKPDAIGVYDVARNRDAGAIVVYTENGEDTLPALGSYATNAVIDSISDSINEDGDVVKKVTYVELNDGAEEPVFVTGKFSPVLQSEYQRLGYNINAGDYVTISRSGSTITNIKPRVTYSDWKVKDADLDVKFSQVISLDFCAKGKLLDYTDSVISVLLDDDDPDDGYDNKRVVAIPTYNLTALVRFNPDIGSFEKITPSEMRTAHNSGLEGADRILVRCAYLEIFGIALYSEAN